jgi:hypothetical protein
MSQATTSHLIHSSKKTGGQCPPAVYLDQVRLDRRTAFFSIITTAFATRTLAAFAATAGTGSAACAGTAITAAHVFNQGAKG